MDDKKKEKSEQEDVILGSETTPESDSGQARMAKNDECEELELKLQKTENNYKRAVADYQNLQRRTQEEKINWIKSASKDLILKMFPVLDTLILANKHLQDKGLDLSIDQFLKVLKEEGVEKIETIGKEFDPHLMEAITTQQGEDNKVLEEIRAGYMLYDMVLRTAQVVVGKK